MTAELKASRSDATLILTMSNPGLQNALDSDLLVAAIETFTKTERDDSICCVILSGADLDFCSGMQASKDLGTQIEALEKLQHLIDTVRNFPKPVIAAVEGLAMDAGFSLALACDLIVASQRAGFGISPGQVGTWAIGGAPWLLSKTLPAQWLTEILLDPSPLTAARLYSAGLVNKLVANGSVLTHAQQWAAQLSSNAAANFEKLNTLLDDIAGTTLNSHFALERHRLLTKRPGLS